MEGKRFNPGKIEKGCSNKSSSFCLMVACIPLTDRINLNPGDVRLSINLRVTKRKNFSACALRLATSEYYMVT